ncbi:HNH endonuclease [Fodinibius sp. SL11]|uniref:HNH endonuclease n=1 Tax=Fodinibius sp. SL11 TaxID=3425690 RepID=UPI003F8812DE
MHSVNKYGLKRDIPASVKREVRQKYGFGCIICGSAIIEYDHFDPPYREAKEHDPEGITILCPQCHSKVSRGIWSREKVFAATESPKCLEDGYTSEIFDIGGSHPTIKFGGVTLSNCEIPVQISNIDLFKIQKPEKPGAPFRLSATFFDQEGKQTLRIEENEWVADSDNWDLETKGPRIIIREALYDIHLIIRAMPPKGIAIERMKMRIHNHFVEGDEETLTIYDPNAGSMNFTNYLVDNCKIGLSIG